MLATNCRTIEPTVLVDPQLVDSEIHDTRNIRPFASYSHCQYRYLVYNVQLLAYMTFVENLFDSSVSLKQLKNVEDSAGFIRARPKPLVIYVFNNNEKLKSRVVDETSSGSVTFNDVLMYASLPSLLLLL